MLMLPIIRTRHSQSLPAAIVFSWVFLFWQPVAAQVSYELVVDNDTTNLSTIISTWLANNSEVAFQTSTAGGSISTFAGGSLSTLAAFGTPVPGFDDETFSSFDLLQEAEGNRFIEATITSPPDSPTPADTTAIFTQSSSGALALHMDVQTLLPYGQGQVVIGDPDLVTISADQFLAPAADRLYLFVEASHPVVDPATGDVGNPFVGPVADAFTGEILVNPGFSTSTFGLFVVDATGTPNLVLDAGASLPGIDGATVAGTITSGLTNIGLSRASFAANAAGQLIGIVKLEGAGLTTGNDEAVVLVSGGTVTVLAREGDSVPGGGANFGSFGSVGINAGGQLVFADINRIYTGTGAGDLGVAVIRGIDGASHEGRAAITDDGAIVFFNSSSVVGGIPTLFQFKDGTIQTLATQNDEIPGTGLIIDRLGFNGADIAVSADGKIVIRARLRTVDTEVTTADDEVLLALDGKGKLVLLAREGTPIMIPDGMGGEVAFEVTSGLDLAIEPGTGFAGQVVNTGNQILIKIGSGLFIATVDDFLQLALEFVWNGDCGNRNWHTGCGPATNWEDENTVSRGSPPGAGGDETVRIVGADVDITDAAVSVGALQATGSLKVATSLTVNAPSSIQNLILEGDLAANGALRLSGMGNLWTAGTIGGLGGFAPVTLDPGSNMRIETDTFVELDTLFNVEGALRHEKGTLILGADASFGRIDVLPGGEYAIESGGIVDDTGGNALITLDGTLRKTTAGAATIGVPVVSLNQGAAIVVEGGSLTLTAGGQHKGTHTVASGSNLTLQGGATRVTGPLMVSGEGTVGITGGTYRIEDGVSAAFDLALAGDGLQLTGTMIEADGLLENMGRAVFDDVVLGGATEMGGLSNHGNLIFRGAGSQIAAPLSNEEEGLVLQEVNVEIPDGQGDGTVTNRGTYVIGAETDVAFTDSNLLTTSRFVNEENATLRKTGAGASQIFAVVENKGNIVVEAGTLELRKTVFTAPSGIGSIADITVNTGANLIFANSPDGAVIDHRFVGDFDFLGEGTVRFVGLTGSSGDELARDTEIELTGTLTNRGATIELEDIDLGCMASDCTGVQLVNDSGTLLIGSRGGFFDGVDLINMRGAEIVQSGAIVVPFNTPRPVRFVNRGTWRINAENQLFFSTVLSGSNPDRSDAVINSGLIVVKNDTKIEIGQPFFATDDGAGGTVEVMENATLTIKRPDPIATFEELRFTGAQLDSVLRDGDWIVNPNASIIFRDSLTFGITIISQPASVTIRGNPADSFVEDGEIGQLPNVRGQNFTNEGTLRLEGATFNVTANLANEFGRFTNAATGVVQLAPGTLNIEGGAGLVNRGTISGTGIINGEVFNDAVFDVGLSPGAITVNGDFTQGAEGSLLIELGGTDPGVTFDQLIVDGTATFKSGAMIDISLIDPEPDDGIDEVFRPRTGDVFPFLVANDIVLADGLELAELLNFTNLPGGLSFGFGFSLLNGMTLLELEAIFGSALLDLPGLTPGQTALAGALDAASMSTTNQGLIDFALALDGPATDAEKRDGLDQAGFSFASGIFDVSVQAAQIGLKQLGRHLDERIWGQIAGSDQPAPDTLISPFQPRAFTPVPTGATVVDSTRKAVALFANSMAAAEQGIILSGNSRYAVYATGSYETGSFDPSINQTGLDYDGAAGTLGAEFISEDGRRLFGVAGTITTLDSDIDLNRGKLDATSWSIAAYALGNVFGPVFIDAVAGYVRSDIDTHRTVSVPGAAFTATGNTDVDGLIARLRLSAPFNIGGAQIGPVAELRVVDLDADGFEETGTGDTQLSLSSGGQELVTGRFGLTAASSFELRGTPLRFKASGAYEFSLENDAPVLSAAFTAAPDIPFQVFTDDAGDDAFVTGISLSTGAAHRLQLGLDYTGRFAADGSQHAIMGRIHFAF